MYDTLHLTEHIRSYDESSLPGTKEKRVQYATNDMHTIDRQLIRMMLAMPDSRSHERYVNHPTVQHHLSQILSYDAQNSDVSRYLAHIVMVYKSSGLASSGIHIDYKTTDYLYRETETNVWPPKR